MTKNTKIIVFITIVIALVALPLFHSKLFTKQAEIKYDVISSNIQAEIIDKVEAALKDSDIPYDIEINDDMTYNLVVNAIHTTDTLRTLCEYYIDTREMIPINDKIQCLSDKISFDDYIIDILIHDYRDKLSKRKENDDEMFVASFIRSTRVLEYYISRQLFDIQGISYATINIASNDPKITFVLTIKTTEYFDNNDSNAIKHFLTNTTNARNIVNELEISGNTIMLSGTFEWDVTNNVDF